MKYNKRIDFSHVILKIFPSTDRWINEFENTEASSHRAHVLRIETAVTVSGHLNRLKWPIKPIRRM